MKNTILLTLILFIVTACTTSTPQPPKPSTQEATTRSLIIDLDKEEQASDDLRGKGTLLIDSPIYIGDNDEVSFIGDIIQKESPIQVKIGDNDEVAFTGSHFKVSTMELRNGDMIQITGKSGNVFVEVEVVK